MRCVRCLHGKGLLQLLLFSVFFLGFFPVQASAGDEAAEREFFQLLQTQASDHVQKLESSLSPEKRGAFRRVMAKVLDAFQDRFDLKGFLARQSRVVSKAYPIAWIIDHVMITTLFAIGEPALAVAIYASPSPTIQTTVAVTVAEGLDTYRLMRDLELRTQPWKFWQLSRQRRRILGGSSHNHLLVALAEAANREAARALPVHIVRKIKAGMAAHAESYLARSELETLIQKSPGGVEFLESIRPLRQEPQLHTMLMFQFIQTKPGLAPELQAKIAAEHARKAALPASSVSAADAEARRRLLAVAELRERVDHLTTTVGMERARHSLTLEDRIKRETLGLVDSIQRGPGMASGEAMVVLPGFVQSLPEVSPEAARRELELRFLRHAMVRADDRLEAAYLALSRLEFGILYESMTGAAPSVRIYAGVQTHWSPAEQIARHEAEVARVNRLVARLRELPTGRSFSDAVEEFLTFERALFPEVTAELQSAGWAQHFAAGTRSLARGCVALFRHFLPLRK